MSVDIPNLKMGRKEWGLLLLLSALWGGSFFFFKILVRELPPFTVVLGRVGIAAALLNLVLLVGRDRVPGGIRLWGAFFVMGLLNNVIPFTLIVYGETRISSGMASILNAMTPIFTVLAAHVFTSNEKLSSRKMAGVLCGFLGVMILIGPNSILQGDKGNLIGEASCLLAALSYAIAGIFGRRFRGIPPMKVATGQITASTAMLIPFALIVDRPWTLSPPSTDVWLALFGIALLSTAFAYMIYFRILATSGATNIALVTFLLPISALLLGTLFLNETISAQALAGMVMIGLGLAAIDGRLVTVLGRLGRLRRESSLLGTEPDY